MQSATDAGIVAANFWIGVNDRQTEGQFGWVRELNGIQHIPQGPDDYANWASGEPSSGGNRDCGDIVRSTGEWRIRTCTQKKPYVCIGARAFCKVAQCVASTVRRLSF